MKKTFLGKLIPEHKKQALKRAARPALFALLVLPAIVAGGMLSLQKSQLNSTTGPRTTGGALAQSIAAVKGNNTLAIFGFPVLPVSTPTPTSCPRAEPPVPGFAAIGGIVDCINTIPFLKDASTGVKAGGGDTGTVIANPCTLTAGQDTGGTKATKSPILDANGKSISINQVSEAFRRVSDPKTKVAKANVSNDVVLFPLIPDGIRGVKRDGTTDLEKQCSQGFWTRDVAYWFVYKGLAILNWLATALAILLTIYGGVLYMTGFANEANVKKAKGIITGAYIGLAIVFLAKILVYGSVTLVSNTDPTKVGATDLPLTQDAPGASVTSGTSATK